jgi:hypothetical protein
MVSEIVLKEWMALCQNDSIAASKSPIQVLGATPTADEVSHSEGESIFASIVSWPEPEHAEGSMGSHLKLDQMLTSFGAFCQSMTLRLEADQRVFDQWMTLCRNSSISSADSPRIILGATSKSDEVGHAEGKSIFSSITSQPELDHAGQSLESHPKLDDVLACFGSFCKSMTLRLETNEVTHTKVQDSTSGASPQPSHHLKRIGSTDGHPRTGRIRIRM